MSMLGGKPVYVALLHGPVLNRQGLEVTTAVTNMDIHDISRTARTYGARGYFIVTPIAPQRGLVERILEHWRKPDAKDWHPDRVEALSLVRLVSSFDEVLESIRAETGLAPGEKPEVVFTDARPKYGEQKNSVNYAELRGRWQTDMKPALIVFGTGFGISERFLPVVDTFLAPIFGPDTSYNHLSVRAATAAIMDRLFGDR